MSASKDAGNNKHTHTRARSLRASQEAQEWRDGLGGTGIGPGQAEQALEALRDATARKVRAERLRSPGTRIIKRG